jgi:hypothetical protein
VYLMWEEVDGNFLDDDDDVLGFDAMYVQGV